MDITNFMTWFVSQTINIFTSMFNILDSITFAGTSLLRVIVTIIVLSSLLGVILTISHSVNFIGHKSEQIKKNKERSAKNEKKN